MDNSKLTKKEALELITPVLDEEVSEATRKAFFNFIAQNEDVRRKYKSLKKIKELLRTRCPYEKAPDSLRRRVSEYIANSKKDGTSANDDSNLEAPIYDLPNGGPANQEEGFSPVNTASSAGSLSRKAVGLAASVLLVVGVLSLWFSFSREPAIYSLEEYAYQHFEKNKGQFVEPTIATASMGMAESRLADRYNMAITIPPLESTDFKGILYTEFVPGYKAPMLEYYIPSENQYIYIFAFNIKKMKEYGKLVRHEKAVKSCNNPQDFYVLSINDKYVVSWKWDETWYTAISNHNGERLASLIKPLQATADSSQ